MNIYIYVKVKKIKEVMRHKFLVASCSTFHSNLQTPKSTCTKALQFDTSTIYSSQDKEATYMSTDGWIKRMWCIYTMEHYSVTQRRKPTSVAVAWIDLAIVILSQKERDKYDIAYIYMGS